MTLTRTLTLHNISGEGDGWTTGQWHGYLYTRISTKQPEIRNDIDLIEERRDMLQANLNTLNAAREAAAGLRINISKIKTLVFRSETTEEKMKVGDKELENVTEFEYLGSLISWDNDCGKEIRGRIAKALGAMAGFKKVWTSKEIRAKIIKFSFLWACVFSILLYASESWTLRRQADGIQDEMLQANTTHQMATNDNE